MTLSIKGLYVTLSASDTQHNTAQPLIMLRVIMLRVIMLNVIMLIVVMLSVVIPSVVMLRFMAPINSAL